jgi:PTS system nitrogen regulatory IIA component
MKSLLCALQAGRLVELPSTDKTHALKSLAHLIEAVPEIAPGTDLAEAILKREEACNSGRSLGVACPHARVPGEGDLLCALGWSPGGIDYGAEDGQKVHLIVMYFIPDAQKNEYLKELSALAGAVTKRGDVQLIARAEHIGRVREQLLEWASGLTGPDPSVAEEDAGAPATVEPEGLPLLVVTQAGGQRTVLCENRELAAALERDPGLDPLLRKRAPFDRLGFRFIHRGTTTYDPARPVYDLIAVKIE